MRLTQFALATVFSAALVLPVMAQTAAPTTPAPAVTAPVTPVAPVVKPPATTTTAKPAATTTTPAATTAAKPVKEPKPAPASATNPVSINTGSAEALDTLPGIGKKRAAKIIENRPYTTLDELVSKKSIGPKEFEKIKGKISL